MRASHNPAAGAAADSAAPRPVIVVTGANSGVGLGICERLLVQFSDPTPPDSQGCVPALAGRKHQQLPPGAGPVPTPFAASNGIVLVLGCRNPVKALKARAQLLNLLAHLAALPDDAPTPTSIPRHWLAHPPAFINTPLTPLAPPSTDEDEEQAVAKGQGDHGVAGAGANTIPGSLASLGSVPTASPSVSDAPDAHSFAVAVAASLRRRRERTAAVLSASSAERSAAVQAAERRASLAARQAALTGDADARTRGAFRRRFATRTVVEVASIDLGSMASTLRCAEALTNRWGYVSHLVLNAGLAAWQGLDWPAMVLDFARSFREAVTRPKYKKQRAGDIGKDGLGYVWQCNVGAHYMLARALLPAFRKSPFAEPGRIIWTGSIEAQEGAYHPDDYQCRDPAVSPLTYESTKFQCEIAALGMEERLRLEEQYSMSRNASQSGRSTPVLGASRALAKLGQGPGTPSTHSHSHSLSHSHSHSRSQSNTNSHSQANPPPLPRTNSPRVLLSHPGIVKSDMFTAYLGALLSFFQLMAMYLARWLMSPYHVVTGYKAGIAAVFLCVAPSSRLAELAPEGEHRFSPECDIWGNEYVQTGFVDRWFDPPSSHPARPPSGATEAEKAASLVLSQHAQGGGGAEAEDKRDKMDRPGATTMLLAQDLINKLEQVAAETWTKAGAGQLPPFIDEDDVDVDLVAPGDVGQNGGQVGDQGEVMAAGATQPQTST